MPAQFRIFSYLPNPRVWKALIAAELCGVEVEIVGDKPANLANWLWDFDAHELPATERIGESPHARISRRGFTGTLYKTDEFLRAHPFGTVPAAFNADGTVGIFESNSILRAVVRASETDHGLYGSNPVAASRIDSFLDATLVFAREAQVYLLAANRMDADIRSRMADTYEFYLSGIEQALSATLHIAGEDLTIADIGFACDLAQFLRERMMTKRLQDQGFTPVSEGLERDYPRCHTHLTQLVARPAFSQWLDGYFSL